MGARVYIPCLGRFLSVDPVQGGTPNPYVYPDDPVNDFDLDGTFSFKKAMRYMSYANPLIAYNGLACGAISAIRGKGFARGYDAGVSASWTAASVVLAGPAVSAAKSVAVRVNQKLLQRAGTYISKTFNGNRARVSLNKTTHLDLKGTAHFVKGIGKYIPTPHVKMITMGLRGPISVNVRPAKWRDMYKAVRILNRR